jgi:hypothetical protein
MIFSPESITLSNRRDWEMASIHKKRLRSGKVTWELTHGKGVNRIRIKAGDSRPEAEATLSLFKRQLAQQGTPPTNATLNRAVGQYAEHIDVNRRPGTARRYKRVLRTQCAFFQKFHPRIVFLKDIKPSHIEDYKRKRFAGEIAETEVEEDVRREEQLRKELESNPKSGSPQANAKYGWLGEQKGEMAGRQGFELWAFCMCLTNRTDSLFSQYRWAS